MSFTTKDVQILGSLYLRLGIEEYSTSVDDNTSTLRYYLRLVNTSTSLVYNVPPTSSWYLNIDGVRRMTKSSYTSAITVNPNSYFSLFSITTTDPAISHNSDGTKTASFYAKFTNTNSAYGSTGISKDFVCTSLTLRGASTLSVPSLTAGSASTISVTKKTSDVADTITWSFGSLTGTLSVPVGSTSVSFTPDLENFCGAMPTSTSGTVTFTTTTTYGTTTVGTSSTTATITLPASVKPTISSVTATPINTNTWIANRSLYVAGYTATRLSISASAGTGASSISYYTITGSTSGTSTSSEWTSSIANTSGAKTFYVTVTDSRGRTSDTYTLSSVSYLAYSAPTISTLVGERGTYSSGSWTSSPTGAHVRVTATGSVSLSAQGNTGSVSVSISGQTPVAQSGNYWYYNTTSITTEYTATATITDSVGNSSSATTTISTISVPFNLNTNLPALGVGKIASKTKHLEVSDDWVTDMAEIRGLGNSIGLRGWNQIVIPTGATSRTHNGITFTNNKDGTVTANGTATAQAFTTVGSTIKANHTYCVCGCSGGALTKYYLQQNYYNSAGTQVAARDYGDGVLFTNYQDGSLAMYILVQSNVTVSNLVFKPQLFDLTAIFGDDVPTLAQFRAMYSADYYPYCSGGFGDLLWQNSSPYSTFAPQSVYLDLSQYKALLIMTYYASNNNTLTSSVVWTNNEYNTIFASSYNGYVYTRGASTSSSLIYFTDCFDIVSHSGSNSNCIPYRIYGLK